MSLPKMLLARVNSFFGGLRPAGGFDETALMGLGQSQNPARRQEIVWYGNICTRETGPMPAEVMLPVVVGLNVIPQETPRMYRGSFWLDDTYDK